MKYASILIILMAIFGCSQSPSDNTNIHTATSTGLSHDLHHTAAQQIKTVMDRQQHLEVEGNRATYTEEDVNIAIPFLAEALKESGFKSISEENFRKKMIAIFGKNVRKENDCLVKRHKKFVSVLAQEHGDEYDYTQENIMISLEHRFIFPVPFLADFIKFKSDSNYAYHLPAAQLARNRYLLNGDQNALTYLLKEDTLFVKNLVLGIGYTEDQKLNDVAMNAIDSWNDQDIQRVAEYIFVKDCKGNLLIRDGLLRWVSSHTSANHNRMAFVLYDYATSLYANDPSPFLKNNPFTYYNKQQKREIAAHILNLWLPLQEKYAAVKPEQWSVADLWENLIQYDPGLKLYLVEHGYFSLPHLKSYLDFNR